MFYTRQGDQGTTCTLRSRNRISKNAPEIEALGALDEINSFIGLCTAKLRAKTNTHHHALATTLCEVQHILFIIQAELAGAPGKTVHHEHVLWLEKMLAQLELTIRPINSFIVSGGEELSALFDIARTIARRAERTLTQALEHEPTLAGTHTQAFMNRLSSFLYICARSINQEKNVIEQIPRQPILDSF